MPWTDMKEIKRFMKKQLGIKVKIETEMGSYYGEITKYADDGVWLNVPTEVFIHVGNIDGIALDQRRDNA